MIAVPLASHGDAEADHALGVDGCRQLRGDRSVLGLTESADAYSDEIAAIVDFDQPPSGERGLVLFFTGLSGSGKSTVAQAVIDTLLEAGERTVTSLDGDVVRRNLSAGLTFSKEDRETNIRRIGWVAAEISRHGGVAVCSPIAPFDSTRKQVRAMVDEAGGEFVLVHIATPLEECERRDRKGLYAKARRGEIPEFTGISSPYEEPEDALLRHRHHRTDYRILPERCTRVFETNSRNSVDLPFAGAGSVAPFLRRVCHMGDLITTAFFSIIAAGFFVGIVVGMTGMGGGALMTPGSGAPRRRRHRERDHRGPDGCRDLQERWGDRSPA